MTIAKANAKADALPVRFSWNAWPVHAIWKPSGSALAATSSTAAIASPELTPRVPEPTRRAAMKPLKRSSCSGPTTSLTCISAFSGIIWPLVFERT